MPNDTGNQFSMPADPIQPTPLSEVKLTDEVAPDLSTPPSFSEPPQPIYSPPVQPPAAPIPASPANFTPARPFPLVTLLLILIAIGATAATYFFYQQSANLGQQLTQLNQTINQQKIQPTPSLSETLTPTPEASLSAATTPIITSTLTNPRSFLDHITAVMASAQKQYPDAQLIMLTGTDVQSDSQVVLKYWFRQNITDKKYLYILYQPGRDLSVVDQQVYVTPDDNIPSLNALVENNQLGLDLPKVFQTALAACPTTYDCANSSTQGQFIKASTLLWQFTFKSPASTKLFVVQIDATTGKILYKNQ